MTTATRPRRAAEIACECCQTPLTGCRDTYSDYGQNLCFMCWTVTEIDDMTVPNEALARRGSAIANRHMARRVFLEKLEKTLETRIAEAEEEAAMLCRLVNKLETRMAAIENELNGHGRYPEEDTTP